MSTLLSLAAALDGSPYSLPDSASDAEDIRELVNRGEDLEARCVAVKSRLVDALEAQLARATRTTEIYESNAIEGKPATLAETSEILERESMWNAESALARYTLHGALSSEPRVQDVVGLAAARILVDSYLSDRDRPIQGNDLRDMHALLLRGQYGAGRYKEYLNSIEGSAHIPTSPVDVPDAIRNMTDWLAGSECSLVWKSAVCHAWLTHIHPFDDGNGRMARLLANYILGFGCYPPLIVKASNDRPKYINALAHSDLAGDIVPLARVFMRVLNRGVGLMEKPDFAWSLFQSDLRVREDSLYVRWTKTADRFLDEVAARLLLDASSLDRVGSLSPSDFDLLARRDKSGNGWIAKAHYDRRPGSTLLVWAGYSSSALGNRVDSAIPFPSFFLSESDPDPKAIRPYRPSVAGHEPHFDEFCLLADEARVLVRRGNVVRRLRLTEAAELFAAVLLAYLAGR